MNLLALRPIPLATAPASDLIASLANPFEAALTPLVASPTPLSNIIVDPMSPNVSIPSVNTTSPKKYLSKTAPELESLKASHLLNLSI